MYVENIITKIIQLYIGLARGEQLICIGLLQGHYKKKFHNNILNKLK